MGKTLPHPRLPRIGERRLNQNWVDGEGEKSPAIKHVGSSTASIQQADRSHDR